jgi:hypothetical protein
MNKQKLQQIKEEYAKEIGYKDWEECINDQPNYRIEVLMDEVALRLCGVLKSLKDNKALTFDDWTKENNYTDDFDGDFRKGDKIVGAITVLKRYNKYIQTL